jgi:hypothetical protein
MYSTCASSGLLAGALNARADKAWGFVLVQPRGIRRDSFGAEAARVAWASCPGTQDRDTVDSQGQREDREATQSSLAPYPADRHVPSPRRAPPVSGLRRYALHPSRFPLPDSLSISIVSMLRPLQQSIHQPDHRRLAAVVRTPRPARLPAGPISRRLTRHDRLTTDSTGLRWCAQAIRSVNAGFCSIKRRHRGCLRLSRKLGCPGGAHD